MLRLRASKSGEETDPAKNSDAAKHKAAVAAGHGKWEKDLALHYPERLWVTLLRMHYRPVHPVRKDIYSTTTLKSYGGTDGHEIWRVGESYMSKDEAIHLAEQLRVSQQPPLWGIFDERFGDSFLEQGETK